MPKVEDIFSQLNEAKYLSTLDLQAGYHHIPLDESSIAKTAFTLSFGKYEYIKGPFELLQGLAYFQELMTGVLKNFSFTITYLEDIIIFSRRAEEHFQHINLRHILSTTFIRPLPSNTQAINNMHPPKTPKQVCAFLGLIGYYRKFIKDFAKMTKPLTLLTCHRVKLEWTPVHHTAFFMLKNAVIQTPILCYPDPAKRYRCIR